MTDRKTSAAARQDRPKIVIERTYRARLQEIWDLWTTKEGFESWWGPQGFRVEVSALEARVGGPLVYDMIADTPEMVAAMRQAGQPERHATRGKFSELQPQRRLALTHLIDFLPGVATYESTIAVEFFPSGDNVRMVVTLDPMHDDQFTQMQSQGFTSQLSKLDARFGTKKGS